MRTKAAILWEQGHPWSVEEIELDAPKENEVLIKLISVAAKRAVDHGGRGAPAAGVHPVPEGAQGQRVGGANPRADIPKLLDLYIRSPRSVAAALGQVAATNRPSPVANTALSSPVTMCPVSATSSTVAPGMSARVASASALLTTSDSCPRTTSVGTESAAAAVTSRGRGKSGGRSMKAGSQCQYQRPSGRRRACLRIRSGAAGGDPV